jgi:hypothetical protein
MITHYKKVRQRKISNIWIGVGGGLLIVLVFALLGFNAVLLDRQNKLQQNRNQILNQQVFNTILNGLSSADPASGAIAASQLGSFPDRGDSVDKALLNLIESADNYTVLKAALYALIQRGISDHQKLVRAFWKLCKIARERDYEKDMELRAIYNDIEYHAGAALEAYLQDAIDGKIPSIGEDAIEEIKKRYNFSDGSLKPIAPASRGDDLDAEYDHENTIETDIQQLRNVAEQLIALSYGNAYFNRHQARSYENSFAIFEVITYLTMLLRDKVALSGVYSSYNPTTLNLHLTLYRLLQEIPIMPPFYPGTERLMYHDVTSGEKESYRKIWKRLYQHDPLMAGNGFSGLLFSINSKGFMYNERIVRIIYGDHSSKSVPAMVYSLLKQHSRISAELIDVKSFSDLITQAQEVSMRALNNEDALSLILFATFEANALIEINTALPDSAHAREAIESTINLVSFLPLEEKNKFNAKKLKIKPIQIVWYDAKNPFDENSSDVFENLQAEFGNFVLKKGVWDR